MRLLIRFRLPSGPTKAIDLLIVTNTFLRAPSLQAWWPTDAETVRLLLPRAPIVDVMQCSDSVADELDPVSFRRRTFSTLLIDLARPTGELRAELSPKSCRHEIDRARTMTPEIESDPSNDQAFRLISSFAKTYSSSPSRRQWNRLVALGHVFTIRHDGELIAAHLVLADPPHRARLLFSATIDRTLARHRRVIGPLNRLLHWSEFEFYKELGVRYYDFGGITEDESSPLASISRFKRSFGGHEVRENITRLAARPLLRGPLRAASAGRMLVRSRYKRRDHGTRSGE